MSDTKTTLQDLKTTARTFVEEREWDQYHPAKNLATNIVVEAVELLEKFTWLTAQESEQKVEQDRLGVEQEVADVFFSLLAFCNRYNIDLTTAFLEKMKINAQKYPVQKSLGSNKKYNEL